MLKKVKGIIDGLPDDERERALDHLGLSGDWDDPRENVDDRVAAALLRRQDGDDVRAPRPVPKAAPAAPAAPPPPPTDHPLGDLSGKKPAEVKRALLDFIHKTTGGRHPAAVPAMTNPYGAKPKGSPKVLNAVLGAVTAAKKKNSFAAVRLSELYAAAKAADPSLSVGGFHDAMYKLQTDRKLRMDPFTQSPAAIPETEAAYALPLDKEIKVYADHWGDAPAEPYPDGEKGGK
jgi:hypothetical protein